MTIVGLAMPGLSALVHEERLSLQEMMDVDSLRLKRRVAKSITAADLTANNEKKRKRVYFLLEADVRSRFKI